MLTQLNIKNVAVIDETDITLGAGLNVLTGETGSGKSIVIDSINMILGERGGRELVRYGKQNAIIQAVFENVGQKVTELAQDYDALEDDDTFMLTRRINENGKSTCRINSAVVPSSSLKQLGTFLVDIHGQHDNQRLLAPAHHIDFLDSFGKDKITPVKEEYSAIYEQYTELLKKLEVLESGEQNRLERIDFLSFRTDELDKACLAEGEEEQLMTEEKLLSNAEDIIKSLAASYSVLYDGEFTAYDALSAALNALSDASEFDEELSQAREELSDIVYKVGDIASLLRSKRDSLEFDGVRLFEIQERLALISSIKRKYGADIGEIIELNQKMHEELDMLTSGGESAEDVRAQLCECEEKLKTAANMLSAYRTDAKNQFEGLVSKELSELDMAKVAFTVQLEKLSDYGRDGVDKVEFLISTNPGEPLKPLSKIASGGELSRIMLALKTVLADADDVATLIFDEIDTGVSGRAAGKIAEKLCKIAKRRQVICITHLAQIACAADNHYLIKKDEKDGMSSTNISLLDERARIEELSRIMGALDITDTTRAHAKQLRCDALRMKEELE